VRNSKATDVFVIFGRDTCPYCKKAVDLAKSKGYPVAYMDLDEHPNMKDTDWKTIPQIFFKGNHVGGYKQLVNYFEALKDG